jgi:HEPN domain-containing protein
MALFREGNIAGVAGLAYQAYESAVMALTLRVNGADPGTHRARIDRARQLLQTHQEEMGRLMEARNVDFYGNIRCGEDIRALTREEAEEALRVVAEIVGEIRELL